MQATRQHLIPTLGLFAALLALGACSGGGTTDDGSLGGNDPGLTVKGDVPLVYVKRADSIRLNPTDGGSFAPGGDLMLREKSSASATEYNLTARFTQGVGDVSDPEVSYDGKKVVFAMRCPGDNTAQIDGQPACTGRWNIWEYDMSAGSLTGGSFRRITASDEHDDVDPVYLPGGRGFVFSSNRQTKSHLDQALGKSYYALDEYERQRVFNLHTMKVDGSAITQISFNQSHDRNPVIRPNGDVMFSRWDHAADRNHFPIFRMKPDGTDTFVLYGAFSEGNTYLNPRDMDPKGAYAGQVSSDMMALQRTHEGGALVRIDIANYSEQNTPANSSVPAQGGQSAITEHVLSGDRDFSPYGRVTTPYPLWDGTDRILVAWRPCEVHRGTAVVSCATLTSAELTRLTDSERTLEQIQTDELQDDVPPHYAIYMFDPKVQTWLLVAAPAPGFLYTDPIALQPRAEPKIVEPTNVDADLAEQNLGLVEVRSVYDTDGLGRMSDPVLADADRQGACADPIPKTTPIEAGDTRAQVADLRRIKDPADPAYQCGPARFVRAVRAVAPPSGSIGLRRAIGETNFEPQQILGYAPIEPDGSFKLRVPADVPLALAIIDAEGRAYSTHTNWIQVRPGERRTCDGCHSPRRGGSLNSGTIVNTVPAAWAPAMANARLLGETMASTRTRLDPEALKVTADLMSQDVWADPANANAHARATLSLRYSGNTNSADDLRTPAPSQGVINYPEHIQPLWERDRGSATCTRCHGAGAKLDLSANIAGIGRLQSYQSLLVGAPIIDPVTGLPQTRMVQGIPQVVRQQALVDTTASVSEAAGLARKSRLMEILSGQTLMVAAATRTLYPTPTPDHTKMLNAAERRLLAEWMDLGGQYYNDPFNANAQVREVAELDQATFEAKVLPVLRSTCATACHMGVGSSRGADFRNNRYILTGDPEGDLNASLAMINDTCHPASNPLLSMPSTRPHPSGALNQTTAVLPTTSAGYQAIAAWILTGCPK